MNLKMVTLRVFYLKAKLAEGGKPYYEIGVEAARQASIANAKKYGGNVTLDGVEREIIVPSPYDKDGIPVTIYHPSACQSITAPTILIYFHGGGNTLGCRQTHETVCKIIARDTPCIVLNVEYRLAPEHKFPANTDDGKVVVQWVSANKTVVGGGEASKICVSGDSAGGRISAVVCHELHNIIDFAVLVYPNVDSNFSLPSVKEFEEGPLLSKVTIDWFCDQCFGDADRSDVRASPLLNKDFSKLPPTLLIVAELDPLKDGCYGRNTVRNKEMKLFLVDFLYAKCRLRTDHPFISHAYYKKLQEAGVNSKLVTVKGVPHAFWSICGSFEEACKEAHSEAVKFIQEQQS